MENVKELWEGLEKINVREEIKKAEAVLEDIEKKARKFHILRKVAIAGTVITLMAFPVDYLIRNKAEPDIISLVLLLTSGIFGFAWFALNQEIENLELKAEEFQPLVSIKNAKGIIAEGNLYPIDMVSFYKRERTLPHLGDKHVIYFVEVPEKTEPIYLKFCKPAHELTEKLLSHV